MELKSSLEETGQSFFQQIVELGHVPMMVTTREAVIQYVNPEFCRMTGYSFEELVGQKPSILKSGQTPESVYQEMWGTIMRGEGWNGELINKRKNGEIFTESIYISCIKSGQGALLGYIGIWVDVTGQKQREEEMRVLAITDPLTGLFNRRGFVTHAVQAMKVGRREKKSFQLLLMDIDGLKGINDQYGHKAGDTVIIEAAQVLRETFRDCDILARLGGDEFAAVLLKSEAADLGLIHERLEKNIARCNAEKKAAYALHLSAGSASFDPQKTQFLEQLLQEADRQLYRAKGRKKSAKNA